MKTYMPVLFVCDTNIHSCLQIDNAEKQRQNDIAEMTNLIGDLEKDVRELIFDFDEVAEVIANI